MPRLARIAIFTRDFAALPAFYSELFGFAEIEAMRSPVFCVLDTGATGLGFYAPEAYGILSLPRPDAGTAEVGAMLTVEVDTADAVDGLTRQALTKGAGLVGAPAATRYGWYMAVLRDPEGNAFRIGAPLPR